MQTVESELIRVKKMLWASLLITLPSAVYIFLNISVRIGRYLFDNNRPIPVLTYLNLFLYILLPIIGVFILLYAHLSMLKVEKFKRHASTISKMNFYSSLLLIYFIILLIRVILFLAFSF
jgi:hypothetical protein